MPSATRCPATGTGLSAAASLLLALVVCGLITIAADRSEPHQASTAPSSTVPSAPSRKSWVTVQNRRRCCWASRLAVTPAFKMRFWNIGAEGQILIGCLRHRRLHDPVWATSCPMAC
ncbi:MAG: hypothetical protein ACLUS6_00635 [Dysosmobacter sp.]